MSEHLKEHETVDKVSEGRVLIQNETWFKFGTDAVALCNFVDAKPNAKVLDMCTGSGIIPLLLSERLPDATFDAIELMPQVADMAQRSMKLNGLSDTIRVTCGDVKNAVEIYGGRRFDIITCNPPYMNEGGGLVNPNQMKAAARHEVFCTLEDVINAASSLLLTGGRFFMVHRPRRLTDILCMLRAARLEPKRLQLIQGKACAAPDLVLVEARLDGGRYLNVLPTFIQSEEV